VPEHGDDQRPRPPRRVPPGAGGTVIEAPAEHGAAQTPVRRPPRAWYLLPLVLALIAAGAGAGWLAREQQESSANPGPSPSPSPTATLDLLAKVRPSVVQVLATTCQGTGQAAGIVLTDDLVLTAAAAVSGPVSIAVRLADDTPDGMVRTARVEGTSADGLALLRVSPGLGGTPVTTAPAGVPVRSLVRYDGLGRQVLDQLTADPLTQQLRQIGGLGPLGAPAFDAQGRVAGLVSGHDTTDARLIGAETFGRFLAADPVLNAAPVGECESPSGPRGQQTPALVASPTELAKEVQVMMASYLNAVNRHEFALARSLYAEELKQRDSLAELTEAQRSSYWFGARIVKVDAVGDGAVAVMRFTVVHAADSGGPVDGESCTRWNLAYRLVRENGKLRILVPNPAGTEAWVRCDG
jgi:hypothetical protein